MAPQRRGPRASVCGRGKARFKAQGAGTPESTDQAMLMVTREAKTRDPEKTGCGPVPGGLPV